MIETAVICPKCGSPTARFNQMRPSGNGNQVQPTVEKSKSVAVVLALFLGVWSFLYTYKKDMAAFWIGLGLQIFLLFGILAAPSGGSEGAIILVGFAFGLVAFIVAVSRNSEWYQRYPNN